MHESLLLLERLYAIDAEADERRARLRQLKRTLDATDAAIAATDTELAGLEERRGQLLREERDVQDQLDRYLMRRKRTQEQLDQGLINDVLVAQRQLDNFAGIIDGLEVQVLDLMEQREKLGNKRAAVDQRQRLQKLRRQEEATLLDVEGGDHTARLAELEQRRGKRVADIPQHLLAEYQDVRSVHRDALAQLRDGACTACHMHHPPQIVLEVRRGSRLHHCRGCNRFLAGVQDPTPEAPPDEDAD